MYALAVAAFDALERAELADVLDTLHIRFLSRPPGDLMDVEMVDGVWLWRFKPIIELMLRHIAETAINSTLSPAARRTEVQDVLHMLEL
jgi:hypothetical protein